MDSVIEKPANSYVRSFATVLNEMTDDELAACAKDYLWLAECQPSEVGRETYTLRRDLVVTECERRDRLDIVERLRQSWKV